MMKHRLPIRRFRFSIRTVLVIVALVAIALGFYIMPGIEQERRIDRLSNLGARINYLDELPYGNSAHPMPGPDWARNILGEHFFTTPSEVLFIGDCADTPAAVELISGFPFVKRLTLGAPSPSAADLSKLRRIRCLENLSAVDLRFGDDAVKEIGTFQSLKQLQLRNCNISDNGVENISHLDQLEWLDLGENPSISDAGVQAIPKLTKLNVLSLQKCSLTFHRQTNFQNLRRLQHLTLSDTNLDDEGAKNLADLRTLIGLGLSNTRVTSQSLETIERLPSLELLWLDGTHVSNSGLERLARIKNLKLLSLAGTAIDDSAIKTIAKCRSLRSLILDQTKVTDDGLAELGSLPELYDLSICNTAITDRGLMHLDKVPSLMEVHATGSKITQAGIVSAQANSSDRIVKISEEK